MSILNHGIQPEAHSVIGVVSWSPGRVIHPGGGQATRELLYCQYILLFAYRFCHALVVNFEKKKNTYQIKQIGENPQDPEPSPHDLIYLKDFIPKVVCGTDGMEGSETVRETWKLLQPPLSVSTPKTENRTE